MKVGLQIPHFRPSTPENKRSWLKNVVQTADQGGVYSVWLMDHFLQLGMGFGDPDTEMLEGYSTLGFISGVTEKIKIGLLVGGVIYRHPAILVKTISTLDVLSGGRTCFGVGASWYEYECQCLGLPFPDKKTRFELLEEQLKIAKQMFAGDTSFYQGTHFQMQKPINNPQPLQKPHPPILIGGTGPKKTLRLVAQYADACNFFDVPDAELIKSLDILKKHCEDVGRPYEEIEKTTLHSVDLQKKGKAYSIERAKQLHKIGFEQIICNVMGDYSEEALRFFTDELVPAVRDL